MPRLRHPNLPGTGLVIAGLAALIGWASWTALDRTVLLDGPVAERNSARRAAWPDMRIDINSATAAELSLLPGLGPKLAQRIVDDRDQRGGFDSIDELDRVSGIGESIIERLKPYAVAEGMAASATGP